VIEIPFAPSISNQRFGTELNQLPYIFDARWNVSEGAWYFDLREVSLAPIVFGVKVVLGAYLGRRTNHPLFRRGVIVARDTSSKSREATLDDIGQRVVVRYYTAEEVSLVIAELRADMAARALARLP
jgi:hypothetical protein